MNQLNPSPFASNNKKPTIRRPVSFVEALKSIGGQTVNSLKNDVIKGTAQDVLNSVTGNYSSSEQRQGPDNAYNEWLRQKELNLEREARQRQRHKEIQAVAIYDARQEEVKTKIKSLQSELKALADEIALLGSEVQNAVNAEIVNPGTYHVSYFDKLRKFIIYLRQQVSESNNWLSISSQRKSAQNAYWGGVKKGGTKFMLSQERYMATSAG